MEKTGTNTHYFLKVQMRKKIVQIEKALILFMKIGTASKWQKQD